MLDFDTDLTPRTKTVTSQTKVEMPVVSEAVRVVANRSADGYLAKDVPMWNWSDLRDYIITEIEKAHGPQVRDVKKEAGIIKAFIGRWGIEQAHRIAKTSFTVHQCMWRNAPISISRFSKGSDPYFAQVIADKF